MYTIIADNVNDAWEQAKELLNTQHTVRPSRVGEVWEYPTPVTTWYRYPWERVLFDAQRDANPFFHLMEGLWMLAGRNDVAWLAQFNRRMREFSDDGETFHGAYGYRWRRYFDMYGGAEDEFPDQLERIVRMLRRDPNERRAVLQMWDPVEDLERPDLKDLPCNVCAFFKIRSSKLCMVVNCRSNDIVWGCYGANGVHFSMLLEYMAARIGVPIGSYWQVSDSWHAYTAKWEQYGGLTHQDTSEYPGTYHMVTAPESWDQELQTWMGGTERGESVPLYDFQNQFFPAVAQPMFEAWRAYKRKDLDEALNCALQCQAPDWRLAGFQWLQRRKDKA